MDKVKAALTRKFGPLPAWAWAGIAGVILYVYRRSHSTAASPTDNSNLYSAPSYGEYPYNISGGSGDYGGGGGAYGSAGGGGTGTAGAGTSLPGDTSASTAPTIAAGGGSGGGPTGPTAPAGAATKRQHKQTTAKPGGSMKRAPATIHKGIAARGSARVKAVPRTRAERRRLTAAAKAKSTPTVATKPPQANAPHHPEGGTRTIHRKPPKKKH